VLGIPDAYLPHGKPDAILAEVGLDAAGITASALSLIAAEQLDTPPV
jgi:deoxyxylulose-5-phosphate synthase